MRLYDTMARSLREFTPKNKDSVGLYTCGPTVYDYPHLGNWTGYVYWDVLVRTLTNAGYDVNWFMNITDVGHLTSDADEGEDKLEKGARREGKTAWQVAEFYTEDFLQGLKLLNIIVPKEHLIKATDHIPEQIQLVTQLEEKGYTYKTDDGVYFDTTKLDDYGKLARLDIAGLQAGTRVGIGQKRSITDFALWKFSPANQKRDMEWDSPWGKGFPGWHLECSAMAMKYLGQTLDIHAGGIDHIPVHHTNEIAQSEAATKQPFANYWLHNNHLLINDGKISKSEGNGITLQDIQKRGYPARVFRLFVLQSHFRTQSNFSWDLLEAAQQRLEGLQAFADLRFQQQPHAIRLDESIENTRQLLQNALENDLNTPKALALLSGLEDAASNGLHAKNFDSFIEWLDTLLGLDLTKSVDISSEQKDLIIAREKARDNKDFAQSDQLRQELSNQGILVRDTKNGSIWSRKIV
ncbi:MAG TPA: cysteine--tRNA ligase [Candidatus Saccharibacteria bacterium]|nr:cysteine--tRNA ligase [Candidatus Saccharibacteria bacterium]